MRGRILVRGDMTVRAFPTRDPRLEMEMDYGKFEERTCKPERRKREIRKRETGYKMDQGGGQDVFFGDGESMPCSCSPPGTLKRHELGPRTQVEAPKLQRWRRRLRWIDSLEGSCGW